jgi:hypothetical protein
VQNHCLRVRGLRLQHGSELRLLLSGPHDKISRMHRCRKGAAAYYRSTTTSKIIEVRVLQPWRGHVQTGLVGQWASGCGEKN